MNKEIKRTRGLDITEEENNSWEGRISFLTRKATRYYDKYNKHTVELLGNMLITQFKCMRNQADETNKALKIIIDKEVNIYQIKCAKCLDDYNLYYIPFSKERHLTQEEFDLLKEVV